MNFAASPTVLAHHAAPRLVEAEIVVEPDQFALALDGPARVPMPESRPPRVLVLREAGTRRWACFRTSRRNERLTPILTRAEPLSRVKSYAITAHPPLWEASR